MDETAPKELGSPTCKQLDQPSPSVPTGLLSLVIIVKLESAEIIFEEDEFKSQELQEHCRGILSWKRSQPPSSPGPGTTLPPSPGLASTTPPPLHLKGCSAEPIHFTLAADACFLFLVAVPSPSLGWAFVNEVHKLWYSTSSPTGCIGSELRRLRHRKLEPIDPPAGDGVLFSYSKSAAGTSTTETSSAVLLRPVKPNDVPNLYFNASLFHQARRFRERLDEVRLRSRINKALVFFSLCIILLVLSIVVTCSKGGSLNLSKCFYG